MNDWYGIRFRTDIHTRRFSHNQTNIIFLVLYQTRRAIKLVYNFLEEIYLLSHVNEMIGYFNSLCTHPRSKLQDKSYVNRFDRYSTAN
jgi:hypothetical protein